MIAKLQIENYRCLRDVTLTLEPMTVFVGANASGKSSVFGALTQSFSIGNTWSRDANLEVRVHAWPSKGPKSECLWRPAEGRLRGTAPPSTMHVQLDLTQLRLPNQVAEARALSANGFGLTNLYATLTRREQDEVARQFCSLVPMFADVAARPAQAGSHRLVFQDRWRPGIWYEPHEVSEGSILMLAYLLLSYQAPSPEIVAIEEPERGLHPYLMGQLITVLRKLALGEVGGRPVQVLLATHSAELLNFVEAREIRFFRRSSQTGETVVEEAPVDDPSWLRSLKEYEGSLGDLWLSGGLGGVPGH